MSAESFVGQLRICPAFFLLLDEVIRVHLIVLRF